MNAAHLHLIVNHFPIIGIILGFGILISGILLKNNTIKNISYCIFIISAIFTAISMATGDEAEEMIENMPTIEKYLIHVHEEMAEKLAIVLYLLGIGSIIGLYAELKKKTFAKTVSFIVLLISIVGMFLGMQTGTTGGEIRHIEIRANSTSTYESNSNNENESE